MQPEVFISATRRDLQEWVDGVIQSVQKGDGKVIDMAGFTASAQPPVHVCIEHLEKASHYLGLFAYHRGWEPPGESRSITEIEYDTAVRLERTRGIFVPEEGSSTADSLHHKALELGASEEDLERQRLFLQKVRSEYVMEFGPVDLGWKVLDLVQKWRDGGLLAVAQAGNPTGSGLTSPTKQEIRAAADAMVYVLEKKRAAPVYRVRAAASSQCQGRKSMTQLVGVIGAAFRQGFQSSDVGDLATVVAEKVQTDVVVLDVDGLDEFPEKTEGFMRRLWLPLRHRLLSTEERPAHELICLVGHREELPANYLEGLGLGAEVGVGQLPRLQGVSRGVLADFLRQSVADPDTVDRLVGWALQGTFGGAAQMVHDKLEDHFHDSPSAYGFSN